MADSTKKRGRSDRHRINVKQAYEIRYWKEVFGVSAQQLARAVRQVGPMVKNVAAYLERKTRMSSRKQRPRRSSRSPGRSKRRRAAA
jgi:hypothetical protein